MKVKQLTSKNLDQLQNTHSPINVNQTINHFIHTQTQPQENKEKEKKKIPSSSSSSSIPLKPRVPAALIQIHSSNPSSIINRSQLLKSRRAQNQSKNKIFNRNKNQLEVKKSTQIEAANESNEKTKKKQAAENLIKNKKRKSNNTMSSNINRLPDTLINDDPRKRKKTRLTIERQRVPGIFQNAVSGSARRRNSAGDLEFNPLGFLDKLNPKNKKKRKNPSSSSIPPTRRVQHSSRPASIQRDETKVSKKQPIAQQKAPSQQPSSCSKSPSGPHRDIDHEMNLEEKKQIRSRGQSIPNSTSRPHSDHTSAHSAYSLMMRKKNKVSNQITVPRSSGQNHIPVEHESEKQEVDDLPARRSSLTSHHQPSSVPLPNHQDGQDQQTSVNLDPTLDQQVLQEEPQIEYYTLNDDGDDDHSNNIQQRSLNNYTFFTDPSPDHLNETRVYSNQQNEIETPSLFSLSYYSKLDDEGSIESYYGTESCWIEENREVHVDSSSSRILNISDIPQRMSTPHGLNYPHERHTYWPGSPNSDRTMLTELDPTLEFGYLDDRITSFRSGGSLRINHDHIWGHESNYDTEIEIERDAVDEDEDEDDGFDEDRYDSRRRVSIARHVVVDEYDDEPGLEWRGDDDLEGRNSDYHDYIPSHEYDHDFYNPSYLYHDDQQSWEYMDQDSLDTNRNPEDELIPGHDEAVVLSLDGQVEHDPHVLFDLETWSDFNHFYPSSIDQLEEEEKEKEEIFDSDDLELLQSNYHGRVFAYPHTDFWH